MKYLVLVGDGMADFPLPEHGNKTPLELASTPAMDALARQGLTGLFWPIPDGLAPGSDIGNLSLFGYDPRTMFSGRAPLEAARHRITLSDTEVAFRCNLVTLRDGIMASFTSGHISSAEAASIIETLNQELSRFPVRFHPGVSYRHLAIVQADTATVNDLATVKTTPPHDITDQAFEPHLPSGEASDLVRELMKASQPILAAHPVNEARRTNGQPPATSIWLWGQGRAPAMETYRKRFGLQGTVISAVDLVKGIGVCAGLEVLDVVGATAYLDTDYEGKVAGALDALERLDFAYVHVEAPDETSHEGKLDLKIEAIEAFDQRVVRPCSRWLEDGDDRRVLVAPDHVTALSTKTHAGGPVPFALCGAGVVPNGASGYSEAAARETGLVVEQGHELVCRMLRGSKLDTSGLNGGTD